MTVRDVLNYCRAELEPYKIPAHVRFLAEFPRSETGKPQKFKLRSIARHRDGRHQNGRYQNGRHQNGRYQNGRHQNGESEEE